MSSEEKKMSLLEAYAVVPSLSSAYEHALNRAQQSTMLKMQQQLLSRPPRVSDIQLRSGDLASPLFDAPLSTLTTMWLARFGFSWVTEVRVVAAAEEVTGEWGVVFLRLNARNMFERHTLYDTDESVFRLIRE